MWFFLTRIRKHWARSKTRKTWKFFSEIFKSEFSILAIGQNWKLGNKKTRNNISEISKISEVSKFSICHFSFFKKLFFSIFYSRQFRTFYLCYVCLQSLLKCFFLHQNICSNYYLVVIRYIFCEMYLHSWGHEVCWLEIQWKILTFAMLNVMETIKIWSKWKLSEVSKFSISSIGQNRKLGNLGNWHFSSQITS